MPRKPRFQFVGIPQHLIQRGNNRQACFFAETDYLCYLDALLGAVEKFGARVHAYVLMTNHVHLLVTPDRENALSAVMQSVGRRYVRYINNTYGRSGTLWEGRFKASLIESETYLLSCCRYVELTCMLHQSIMGGCRILRGTDLPNLARINQCAVKGAFSQWVKFPPGNYRSSR